MSEENWGCLVPLEGTAQITRSMLEMLNAKPYTVAKEEKELNIYEEPSECRSIEIPSTVLDNIQLADYIIDAEFETTNNILFSNLIFPVLSPKCHESGLKSISVNNSNSIDIKELEDCTKKGVAAVCASHGYDMATSSAMRVLIDVTQQYIDTFCKSLRQTLDNEALTGQTGFFDSVDQVLHDMNIFGLKELTDFYKERVLDQHKKLHHKSMKLKEKAKALHEQPKVKIPVKVKQETGNASGWRPIPAVEQNILNSNTRWKSFVKTEIGGTPQQDSINPGASSWQTDNVTTSSTMLALPNSSQDYFRIKKQRFGN